MHEQEHQFETDDEVQRFKRQFFAFMSSLERRKLNSDDCLFFSHRRGSARQTIVVQSTSAAVLNAFNAHLSEQASDALPAQAAV